MSVCRIKSLDRRLKKNFGAPTSAKTTKSETVSERTTAAAAEKKHVSARLIPGQLRVKRVPRIDIDKMMMEGVKEMDVMWHSAAEAAEEMQRRPQGWQLATVIGVVKRATKKLMAKKVARQQMKLLQQLTAAGDNVADVEEQSPAPYELPVDQTISSQSCRTDLLKHLLSAAPPRGINNSTYEYHWVLLFLPCLSSFFSFLLFVFSIFTSAVHCTSSVDWITGGTSHAYSGHHFCTSTFHYTYTFLIGFT